MTPQDVALLAVLVGALWLALVAWGVAEWAVGRAGATETPEDACGVPGHGCRGARPSEGR